MTTPALSRLTPLLNEIRRLAALGYGYDDIAVKLQLDPRHVRPFVIPVKP